METFMLYICRILAMALCIASGLFIADDGFFAAAAVFVISFILLEVSGWIKD